VGVSSRSVHYASLQLPSEGAPLLTMPDLCGAIIMPSCHAGTGQCDILHMRTSDLIEEAGDDHSRQLLRRLSKNIQQGDVIFAENSQGSEMYILRSGQVKLTVGGEEGEAEVESWRNPAISSAKWPWWMHPPVPPRRWRRQTTLRSKYWIRQLSWKR